MNSTATTAFTNYRSSVVGHVRPVLWETARPQSDGAAMRWSGLSDHYVRVHTVAQRDLANSITDARLGELDGKSVLASVPS